MFDDPAVDSEHGPATRYEIWRSVDAPDGWTSHDVVDDSAAAREEWLDPDPGAGALHHYRLVAHNGDGPSGDRP